MAGEYFFGGVEFRYSAQNSWRLWDDVASNVRLFLNRVVIGAIYREACILASFCGLGGYIFVVVGSVWHGMGGVTLPFVGERECVRRSVFWSGSSVATSILVGMVPGWLVSLVGCRACLGCRGFRVSRGLAFIHSPGGVMMICGAALSMVS